MDGRNSVWGYYGIVLAVVLFLLVAPFRDVFVYSLFIYYIARPFYSIVRRITRFRTFSALFSLIIVILPIIGIAVYTLNIGTIEVARYAQSIPDEEKSHYFEMITDKINISGDISDPMGSLSDIAQDREVTSSVFSLFNQSLGYFFSFSVDKALSMVFLGNILNAIITAVLAIGVYSVFNMYAPAHLLLPYPILLGILTGVASLVPMIGVKLVWIPTSVYLAINSFIAGSLFSDAVYILAFLGAVNIVVDMIPDFALRPFVSAKGIHTGAMMLSYIFGPMVFGISGIFIGPMILVLVSNYVSIVMPRLRKQ